MFIVIKKNHLARMTAAALETVFRGVAGLEKLTFSDPQVINSLIRFRFRFRRVSD